jgi:tetraacyldisaccharide 4'-kinase
MASDAFRNLISRQRRGAWATCLRGLLRIASFGYSLTVAVRNRLYDLGLKKSHKSPLLIVSVGNLTAGGTGKTPVVAEIANRLSGMELATGILSRGYRSLDSGENDEKLVLDRLCPGIPHWQNPDRVAGATAAKKEQPDLQALVLDDAFQHRRIIRDLDIVLIDATNPWGYGYLLPRGLLRESKPELNRADLIVITRADQVEQSELEKLKSEIRSIVPDAPLIVSRFAPTGWLTLDGEKLPLEEFRHRPVIACCGIGNPEGFRQSLSTVGCVVKDFHAFPDHHHYDQADFDRLQQSATGHNADVLVMTLKDLVKFSPEALPDITVAALLIEWEMLERQAELQQRLERLAGQAVPDNDKEKPPGRPASC